MLTTLLQALLAARAPAVPPVLGRPLPGSGAEECRLCLLLMRCTPPGQRRRRVCSLNSFNVRNPKLLGACMDQVRMRGLRVART